jgi:DnaJ-class molecular chaperone
VFSFLVCPTCNGEGEVKCSKCKGTGSLPSKCDECKGTGKLTTEKGVVECDICNGAGVVQIKCPDCFGGGKLVCETCGGASGGTEDLVPEESPSTPKKAVTKL